ncbi:MAG: amidase family protein [Pseudomonadales bacterium]|nr:amidase family protein [Pseudomonadales bacterium]
MTTKTWSTATAAARITETFARIATDDRQVQSVFTETFVSAARQDLANLATVPGTELSGALISVKDLFDVKGFVTRAGSHILQDNPAATADAEPIGLLREAGAILVGHTNMTELAYSGLGLNPHFGTPENVLYADCIPGGSSSGGAVSVARGLVDIAIGTDTGGSVRIPAAFNGIVGFKPSQYSVSRRGCKALSRSLDSVGPMAKTVVACRASYQVISNNHGGMTNQQPREFVISTNFGMNDLSEAVASAFATAVGKLADAGCHIVEKPLAVLDDYQQLPVWHFSSVECYVEYQQYYQTVPEQFDPRVLKRLHRALEVDAISYRQTLNQRQALIEQYQFQLADSILLLPTVPVLPPKFNEFEQESEYDRLNLLILRNPTLSNVMDGCSISLPFCSEGHHIGVMLSAVNGRDQALLNSAEFCEQILTR